MNGRTELSQPPVSSAPVRAHTAASRKQLLLMSFIIAGGVISYMDRAVFGVLAPLIRRDLALDAGQLGLALGLFGFGYALFTGVGGWAADRFGTRIVLSISMLAWSLLCGLTGATGGLISLLTVRFLFGLTESPWVPASSKAVSQWFARDRYASAIGIASCGQPLGGAVAGPLAGLAAAAIGWRASFAVVASIGFLWSLAWVLWAPRATRPPEVQPSTAQLPPAESTGGARAPSVLKLLWQPAIVATAFSFAAANYLITFFFSWFPSYLMGQRGMSEVHMSVFTSFPWIVGTVALLAGGFLSDFLRRKLDDALFGRKIILVSCLLVAGVCVALVPLVSTASTAVALMTLAVGLLYLSGPNYYAIINELVPASAIGSSFGIVVIFVTCAGIISPVTAGYLIKASGSYLPAFMVTGAISVLGAVAFAVGARRSVA